MSHLQRTLFEDFISELLGPKVGMNIKKERSL